MALKEAWGGRAEINHTVPTLDIDQRDQSCTTVPIPVNLYGGCTIPALNFGFQKQRVVIEKKNGRRNVALSGSDSNVEIT